MPRIIMIFWEHMVHKPYSFIFIRPVLPPPLISIIIYFLHFFIFFKKMFFKKCNFLLKTNIFIILIAVYCRLDSRFSIFWIKGRKRGAA